MEAKKSIFQPTVKVINILAASLLVYPCTALDTPTYLIKETDKIFCEFLWNGRVTKIARDTMTKQNRTRGP